MKSRDYELDSTVLKSKENLTLHRSDVSSVEIGKGTLAVAVRKQDRKEGYVFLGHGKLLVDTIVETEKGAVGKPVEKELCEPFLMLGNIEEIAKQLATADNDDLTKTGLSEKEFLDKAQSLLDLFSGKQRIHGSEHVDDLKSVIFAFSSGDSGLDVLLLKGSKLVYKTKDTTFLSSGHKVVLQSAGQVVLSTDGRSLIVEKPCAHFCCH